MKKVAGFIFLLFVTLAFREIVEILGYTIEYPAWFEILLFISIFIGLLAMYTHSAGKKTEVTEGTPDLPQLYKRPWHVATAIAIVVILISGLLRIQHIGEFYTVDEGKYIGTRIPDFISAVADLHPVDTLTSDKPGVPMIWTVAVGVLIQGENPWHAVYSSRVQYNQDIHQVQSNYAHMRIPLLVVHLLLLFIAFVVTAYWTRKPVVSVFFVIFVSFMPYLMAISRILNPDNLLPILNYIAIVSFAVAMRDRNKKMLLFAAFFYSAAVLTKVPAIFLSLFLPVIGIIYYAAAHALHTRSITQLARDLSYFYIGAIGFAFILFPYFFAHPQDFLHFFFLKAQYVGTLFFAIIAVIYACGHTRIWNICTYIVNGARGYIQHMYAVIPLFFVAVFILSAVLKRIPEVSLAVEQKLFMAGFNIFYSLPVVMIVGLLVATVFFWKKNEEQNNILLITILYIFLFLCGACLFVSNPNTEYLHVRYVIVLVPFFLLLAAHGMQFIRANKLYDIACGAVVVVLLLMFELFPFISHPAIFSNVLYPHKQFLHTSWGEGGYEAAQFFYNTFDEETEQIRVYQNYDGFKQFFDGRVTSRTEDPFADDVDYFVFFGGYDGNATFAPQLVDYSRYSSNPDLYRYYRDHVTPVYEEKINDISFIRIVERDREQEASWVSGGVTSTTNRDRRIEYIQNGGIIDDIYAE